LPGRDGLGVPAADAGEHDESGKILVDRVRVDEFWIEETEVTNADFRAFVAETGYVTTAERPVDWEELKKQVAPGTPMPSEEALAPGALVFTPPNNVASIMDFTQWWTWVSGANWKHPLGPGSSIDEKDDYPVVQVSWFDAAAYAEWAGKSLPTEAQWERAARFGQDAARFAWGTELTPDSRHLANIWQGTFPLQDDATDGFAGAAPVRSFPPNELGAYDMVGNVWEWTADMFQHDAFAERSTALNAEGCCYNPTGPSVTADPRNPHSRDSRVQKGGSFLCHADYCSSYRPSAKMGTPSDTGLSHVGFRCVYSPGSPLK
jgi:formylglycine-generating enzyme required for sulfatase activity